MHHGALEEFCQVRGNNPDGVIVMASGSSQFGLDNYTFKGDRPLQAERHGIYTTWVSSK